MKPNIQTSIVQRVKNALNIKGQCGTNELYNALREYRNQIHPDKYTDPKAKEIAEAKFKETQEMLSELIQFIQNEEISKTPKGLALYKQDYQYVLLQHQFDVAKEEIDSLKTQLEWREREKEELRRELQIKEDARFAIERNKLERMYKPTKINWASLGITFILTSVMAAMSKVEEISEIIISYSPLSQNIINIILFIIFISMLLLTIKGYIENRLLRDQVDKICSSNTANEFMRYLSYNNKWKEKEKKRFNESDVLKFINYRIPKWKLILSRVFFSLYNPNTLELLKNCFINQLLQKHLIEVSYARELDRTFTIEEAFWL